jgi:PIN domain nuclease of toxin-antitoxin system
MVPASLVADDFRSLPLQHRHAFEVAKLPMFHRDPFDRMLIAQARVEDLVLVSADGKMGLYEVPLFPL